MTQIYAVLIALLVAAPAAAEIFAYKTEDGVFAYTDDVSKVPARYRAQMKTVAPSAAEKQFTVVQPEANAAALRSRDRLDALRWSNDADRRNARAARAKAEAAKPAAPVAPPRPTIIVIQPRNERLGFPQRQRHLKGV